MIHTIIVEELGLTDEVPDASHIGETGTITDKSGKRHEVKKVKQDGNFVYYEVIK